jgi:hypothetical protein
MFFGNELRQKGQLLPGLERRWREIIAVSPDFSIVVGTELAEDNRSYQQVVHNREMPPARALRKAATAMWFAKTSFGTA